MIKLLGMPLVIVENREEFFGDFFFEDLWGPVEVVRILSYLRLYMTWRWLKSVPAAVGRLFIHCC